MSKSDTFKYSPDSMDYAINAAKKVDSAINEVRSSISAAKGSCPSYFSSSSFSSGLKAAENVCEKATDLEKNLIEMKNSAESYIKSSTGDTAIFNTGTYEMVKLDTGQSGFLYIPSGYKSTAGLPLVVNLGGMNEMASTDKNWGFSQLIKNGYTPNAVIWTPIATNNYGWCETSKGKDSEYYQKVAAMSRNGKAYATVVSCEELVDKLNLDRDRISIFGYSMGAHGTFEYIANYPNYFSTAVTYGGYALTDADRENAAKSGTTIIMIAGSKDDSTRKNAPKDYEYIKANGGQIVLYEVEGATHGNYNDILTEDLIEDVINTKKGQKVNVPNQPVKVNLEDLQASTIINNGNRNTWYERLSSSNNSSSPSQINTREEENDYTATTLSGESNSANIDTTGASSIAESSPSTNPMQAKEKLASQTLSNTNTMTMVQPSTNRTNNIETTSKTKSVASSKTVTEKVQTVVSQVVGSSAMAIGAQQASKGNQAPMSQPRTYSGVITNPIKRETPIINSTPVVESEPKLKPTPVEPTPTTKPNPSTGPIPITDPKPVIGTESISSPTAYEPIAQEKSQSRVISNQTIDSTSIIEEEPVANESPIFVEQSVVEEQPVISDQPVIEGQAESSISEENIENEQIMEQDNSTIESTPTTIHKNSTPTSTVQTKIADVKTIDNTDPIEVKTNIEESLPGDITIGREATKIVAGISAAASVVMTGMGVKNVSIKNQQAKEEDEERNLYIY